MTEARRLDPVLATLAVFSTAALYGLPILHIAPNRLVSGQPLYAFTALADTTLWLFWVVLASLLAFSVACFFKPLRLLLIAVMAIAAAAMPLLLWLAASLADTDLPGQDFSSSLSRASLGSAFWVVLALLGFMVTSALQQLRANAFYSIAIWTVLLLAVGSVLASGAADELSLVKEYANRADSFIPAITRHLQIVLLVMAFTLAVGLPLAWAAYLRPPLGRAVFAILNIVQTIPSIALFGMLMVPLALLAANLPALGRAGISGVGLAPAVIALTLYGLLPVVRSTLTGLQQVSRAMADSAFALGLTRWQVLYAIELPLALPVMLAGVRTAAVATVGMAAVSALIGAGGLGSILFEGLFANAQDLVLLGVLPIIALGIATDLLFRALTAWARARAQQL